MSEDAALSSATAWLEDSPYAAALGVALHRLDPTSAELVLPFQEPNANPGQALHGGCAASLAVCGGQLVARAALGPEAGPVLTAGLQVNYLAAAIGEGVRATATLDRRGKGLCFVSVAVATDEGKPIAAASVALHARGAKPAPPLVPAEGDTEGCDPGKMGAGVEKLGFIASRGIRVEHMAGGTARLRMPWRPSNGDAEGGTHEGAVLALLDTTGAMASWGENGIGPFKASTPSIQAQVMAAAPADELVAYGRVAQRDGELFFSDVEVAGAATGKRLARGTVLYRILS